MNHEEKIFQKLLSIMAGTGTKEETKDVQLKNLTKEVGASGEMYRASPANAGEAELVDNILKSLQTASVINMCKIASRNFVIALTAMLIAILSAGAAIGSAIAAWIAVTK
jgi:hypothetical protein